VSKPVQPSGVNAIKKVWGVKLKLWYCGTLKNSQMLLWNGAFLLSSLQSGITAYLI